MKNSFRSNHLGTSGMGRLVAIVFFMLLIGGAAQAQVSIPGTKVKFTFPSKWKYLSTEKVDANTQRYLYYYSDKAIAAKGDTTLPFLRIVVRKNYTAPIYDFVFDRYSKEPYQSLSDYTEGLGLPKTGGIGYVGAYTNVQDKKDYQFPGQFWRASLRERFGHVKHPAVRLRVKLLDGFAPGAHREPPAFEPACYRDLLLPLDAPLSWVHQVIQKAFYWADYHLHEFQFLDSDARELLDGAFRDLFAIESLMDDWENPFSEPDGEKRFMQASNMSLRWLYHDFAETAEREGVLDNDFPSAQLPENQPLGLFLLGSAEYPKVMATLKDGKSPEAPISKSQGLYYHYDYGSDKELSLFPLEYSMEDAYDLPRIVGAVGHTPPEDSGMSEYREIVDMIENDEEAAAVARKSHYAFSDDEKERFHLLNWARRNGWQPFTSLEDLDGFFGRHTGMGW